MEKNFSVSSTFATLEGSPNYSVSSTFETLENFERCVKKLQEMSDAQEKSGKKFIHILQEPSDRQEESDEKSKK